MGFGVVSAFFLSCMGESEGLLTLSVRIKAASTPANMQAMTVVRAVAFHDDHFLFRKLAWMTGLRNG